MNWRLPALKIVFYFALFSLIWIITTDLLLSTITKNAEIYTKLSIAKGWLYVVVTASLLYWLIGSYTRRRIAAENALKESEARQQAILDNSPAVIYVKDLHGRYLFLNRSAKAWMKEMGVDEDRVIGRTDGEVLPSEIADIFTSGDRQVLDSAGGQSNEEERLLQPDGAHLYLDQKFSLRDSSGNVYATAGIATDITDLKLAEEKIRRQNLELEEVNEELQAFVYSVSHDLRAPLRSIAGFAKFLITDYADKLDDQGRDFLDRVKDNAVRMGRLIEDLLSLSQISRQEIRRTELDIGKIAFSITSDLRASDPRRQVRVDISENMIAYGDERLLPVALTNLIRNAWKFTSKTPDAHVEVGTTEQGGKIIYYVRDNGAGFDSELKENIFKPFHRLHSDREFEGTGIGLAIVERVIRRHGGNIWAEGETGKGATVYFTLD